MSDEKKIIIDEDWKERVAAEKEAAEQPSAEKAGGEPLTSNSPAEAAEDDVGELPPASFEMLVTMFATEAMIGLGQIPHPMTSKFEVNPPQARYAIDMLDMLTAKTKGNLSPAEETGLREILHQLRLAFVAATKK